MRIAQHVARVMIATAMAAAPCLAAGRACHISPVTFDGWHAQQLANDWVRLTIVPQLGGRVMQVSFGQHDFLFINPKFRGQYIPPSAAAGRWINYGGDKIWPLPEGDQDEHHWVLKSDLLDDGEYAFRVASQGGRCAAVLEGPPDPVTGLQYTREISIGGDSPAISFHATMRNIADHPITWSVQSVTQYDLAASGSPNHFNERFFAFTPVNPNSAYFTQFQVRNGLADDPSYEVKGGIFRLHWLYLENEVWLDSTAGWVAIVDEASQFAMIERFTYLPQAAYPGRASVIFYKTGVSLGVDKNLIPKVAGGVPGEGPYYMEAELNSPMVTLRPGETYRFDTEWFPTRASDAFDRVSDAGLVASPATAVRADAGLLIAGQFGVFFPGKVWVDFFDQHGVKLGDLQVADANPFRLLDLHASVAAPGGTAKISLHVLDENGNDRGVLGEAEVKQVSGGTA